MSAICVEAFAASGITELDECELSTVSGGGRVALVIRAIDWIGRVMTVKAVLDALPEVDLAEFAEREQARRPGAGG